MTREEAIEMCQSLKFIIGYEYYTDMIEEALDMAIEALRGQGERRE